MEAALASVAAGGAVVDLNCANIGDAGATQLAEALQGNTTVHTLNLGDNLIGDAGAAQLAEALHGNATVHTVDLGRNSFGAAAATQLAEALRGNAILHTLHLHDITASAFIRRCERIK